MAELLVDTDVCIEHLSGRVRLPGRRSRLVSVITGAELRAGAGDERELALVRRLLQAMTEYRVDRGGWPAAGRDWYPVTGRADRGHRAGTRLDAAHPQPVRLPA